jgi:hypothetical protein
MDTLGGKSPKGTRADIAPNTADAVRHVLTFLSLMVPEQFCGTNPGKNTGSKPPLAIGARALLADLFADIHHAIVAAIVTSSLRDGIVGAHRATPASSIIVVIVVSSIVNAFPDFLLVEEVLLSTR